MAVALAGMPAQAQTAGQTSPQTVTASAPTLTANSGELVVGKDVYPTSSYPTDQPRFDRSSTLLVNTLAAHNGLFGAAAREGLTWANRYVPGTDQTGFVQLYSLSTTGNYGAFFGARSSDNRSLRPQNVIGNVNLVVADGDRPHLHWATYSEGYVPRGKTAFRLLINDENSIQNEGDPAPSADPYDFNPQHLLNNLRVDCGTGMGSPQACTNPLSILNNGAGYRVGILFGDKSIELVDGAANAVAFPSDYALSWYGGRGLLAWRIYSTARGAGAGKFVMADDSMSIDVGRGNAVPALKVGHNAVSAPAIVSSGRPPQVGGNCPVQAQQGGSTAGAFTLAKNCNGGVIVLVFSATAPNGWSCFASNLARGDGELRQTAYDRTSATLSVSGAHRLDAVVFSCTGF